MKRYLLIAMAIVFGATSIGAQSNLEIRFPTTDAERNQNCQNCFETFRQKPKEVSFSIKREGINLYFEVNDKAWFNKLFEGSSDGLAIDIVDKDRYSCDVVSLENSQVKGLLLKPVYQARLKQGLKSSGKDRFRVLVGKIPDGLKNADLEYNILFLGNKTLCNYYVIYDLTAFSWDLLDMGMYLDSLSYKTKKGAQDNLYRMRYKKMKFIIPFEKNKAEYVAEDIKPMYDSLNLTDFNIKKINIKAYSSIEGSLERNIELQQQRANSIATSLQTYQKPTITTQISSSENWVEFLNDIEGTKYADLKSLSKNQVKAKLVGSFNQEIEPILKKHRKAVISLELDRKDSYKNMKPADLITSFNSMVSQSNVDEAQRVLNTIFDNLRYTETDPDILTKLVIPKQKNLSNLLSDMSAFKYQLDERNLIIVRDELKEIEKLDPKNERIKYNLAVLNFKIWRHSVEPIDESKFKNQITSLKNYGIDQALIDRMLINYHIVKSEQYMSKRDYNNKDKAVNYINKNYKKGNLSDKDAVSLAQFLSYYSNVEMAAQVLDDKARRIDVDEDLIFYYLNLTMIRPDLTQKATYRTVMLNAYNLNNDRYCRLFNSVETGGVTFQLLEDEYLRTTYCESCND